MKNLVEIQKKIVPDILKVMEKRYIVLREISLNEPVGRRILSSKLGISERIIRSEVEFLKNSSFIDSSSSGMKLTQEGKKILTSLKDFINEIRGIKEVEQRLKKLLNIKKVIIIQGDSDEDFSITKELGKAASIDLMKIMQDNMTIGVTGGTTMLEFGKQFQEKRKYENTIVVPARGGLGEKLEIQANNIASIIANKIGGGYRILHLPDNINKNLIETLKTQPDIKKSLEYINNLDVIVFGIGRADEMARRRKMEEQQVEFIEQKKAVSEAFGHFFNEDGKIVYEASTIGINLEQFKKMKHAFGIAGGKRKYKAIISISKINPNLTLVIDEGCASEIIKYFDNK